MHLNCEINSSCAETMLLCNSKQLPLTLALSPKARPWGSKRLCIRNMSITHMELHA